MKRRAMRHVGLAVMLTLLTFGGTSAAQVGASQGVANPNLVSEDELLALPHINEGLAAAIIEGRPYLSMTAFHDVVSPLLNDEARGELYARLFVPINLNAASTDEILLVPGVGRRMQHEFEEYRPYAALAEFDREIGKYVDDDEISRLAQYVFVPIDLNTASDEDILSIPGVGGRMLHEFKEYRPYQAIAQFRREIGKYVDDDELARLERYVAIK